MNTLNTCSIFKWLTVGGKGYGEYISQDGKETSPDLTVSVVTNSRGEGLNDLFT